MIFQDLGNMVFCAVLCRLVVVHAMHSLLIFIKTCSGASFGTFEYILHSVLIFPLLALKMRTLAGQYFFYV